MILYFPDITTNLSDYTHLLVWYRVTHSFNLPIGYSKLDRPISMDIGKSHGSGYIIDFGSSFVTPMDWGFNSNLELPQGAIIGMGSMSYQDTDRNIKRTNVCLFNGKLHPFGTSVEFYEKNSFLFENITNQINRDNQLTKILN